MINNSVYLSFLFLNFKNSHSSKTESHGDQVHALTTRSQLYLCFSLILMHLHSYIEMFALWCNLLVVLRRTLKRMCVCVLCNSHLTCLFCSRPSHLTHLLISRVGGANECFECSPFLTFLSNVSCHCLCFSTLSWFTLTRNYSLLRLRFYLSIYFFILFLF